MSRAMPPLAAMFQQKALEAVAVAVAGDLAATSPVGTAIRKAWHVSRVELLYELAFLRTFIEWEMFLEKTFLRYLCGYNSSSGALFAAVAGEHCSSISTAQAAVLGTRAYVLWHNPATVIARARGFLVLCPHETVISSYSARLEHFAAIRHRIAHGQDDAKQKFNSATMTLSGRRYAGARPGRFLRDWDRSTVPHLRWLESLIRDLGNLTYQIE
jgi:hypothetical protein